MQAVHREAQPCQLVCQCGGVELGIAEHHHPLVALADDDLCQIRQLVAAGGLQHILGDLGLALLPGLHGDFLGVVLVQPADIHHLAADGGREHGQRLAGLHHLDDVAHILIKAHVQHFVGFVQHDLGHMGDIDAVVLVVIHQAARGGYHDLAALGQTLCLFFHVGTSIHTGHLHLRHKVGEVGQLLSDLLGKLPGGCHDDGLRVFVFRLDMLHHRDAKGTGLTGAGGCLGDDIMPCQHEGDGLFLNLGHFGKAHAFHSLVDGFAALQLAVKHLDNSVLCGVFSRCNKYSMKCRACQQRNKKNRTRGHGYGSQCAEIRRSLPRSSCRLPASA